MQKKVAGIALAALTCSLLPGVSMAKMLLPASYNFKAYYEQSNYIPSCVSSETCAIFVDSNTGLDTDENDGSKEKPYKSLKKALEDVDSSYYVIAVAEGTYGGSTGEDFPVELYSDVQILGGFYDSFTKRDNSRNSHQSVLSLKNTGTNSRAETGFVINGTDFVLDGFVLEDSTLSAGTNAEMGGVMQIENSDAEVFVTNNTFDTNEAKRGGALYLKGAVGAKPGIVVAGNKFLNNKASATVGGAIFSEGGALIMSNHFEGNDSMDEAGAVFASGDTQIVGNVFLKNGGNLVTTNGGAVVADSNTVVANNYFIDNAKESAVYMRGKSKVLANTFVRNDLSGVIVAADTVTIDGNLFAYNGSKGIGAITTSLTNYVNENNFTWKDSGVSKGTEECDPKFSSKDSNDPNSLKIGAGSDCIDKVPNLKTAYSFTFLENDYFGGKRNLDGNNDGAFGYEPGAHEIEGKEAGAVVVTKPEFSGLNLKFDADSLGVEFQLSQDSQLRVRVQDLDGVDIRELQAKTSVVAGKKTFDWNLKDESGSEVDYGDYKVLFEAENSAGTTAVSKQFVFDEDSLQQTTVQTPTPQEPANNGDLSACAGFVDVAHASSICDAVEYVKDKKIFEGYPDGTFGYNRPISRVEVLKVLYVYTGDQVLTDDGTTLGFSDVQAGAWYMPFVRSAKEAKVVQGYEDGTFKPSQAVARNEFLKIFLLANGQEIPTVSSMPYFDVPLNASTSWFAGFVEFSRKYNLIDVDLAGNFGPSLPMTRGEVAEFIYRYDKAGLGA